MKILKNPQNSGHPISLTQILFFNVKTRPFIFPVWLTKDIQFLYQKVSIFDFSFLFTPFFI